MPGAYSDACRRHGVTPMTFSAARQGAGPRGDPFDFACRKLQERVRIEPFYHHVLIDEGQDFPGGFYELCFALAVGERDQKNIVWAYDELQNILNVKIRSPDELFGEDGDGRPRVSLERAGRHLPPGSVNDTVLSKCYRNQREILVSAHALGFGIYGEIVQLLESRDHWQDVGYEVVSPDAFQVGRPVRIFRPPENCPLSLKQAGVASLIEWKAASSFQDEVGWVVSGVAEFLSGGLQPEDIMVISLDDRNARAYLRAISSSLAQRGIGTNNITADPYDEPPFMIPNKVTLSTVYRAKGNEASVVFAVGVAAIPIKARSGRNRLFTAFTRTKARLRVSGLSAGAAKIEQEIQTAMDHFPY